MGNNRNMDIETAAPGKDPYFVLSGLQDLSLFLSCDRAWPPASHPSYVSLYEIFQHLFPFPSSTYSVFLVPSLLDHSFSSLLGALPSCSTVQAQRAAGNEAISTTRRDRKGCSTHEEAPGREEEQAVPYNEQSDSLA